MMVVGSRHMVRIMGWLHVDPSSRPIGLPFRGPCYQLLPVFALVHSAKALDTSKCVISLLNGEIGLTYKCIPNEIDTVSNVGR